MNVQMKKEINSMVENAKNVYVSSVDENGYPNTKAMLSLQRDGLGIHYFSTNLSSKRVAQFKANPKACIYYCDEPAFHGLMLIGTMEVCTDTYHKELLWREGFERYYPKGVTDDDYCVYKFTAEKGRYFPGSFETFNIEELLCDYEIGGNNMNLNINIGAEIIKQLESAGFRAAFLPYHCMEYIIKTYDELSEKSGSIKYVQNAVNHFRNHQPPDIPFEPLSFLIAAYSGDRAQIVFQVEGKHVAVPLPPTYLDGKEKQRLDDVLELLLKGYQTAHTRGISQKLLTVLSGLGRYGRNNICYIEGFGSYFNLRAFFTDIPCEDFYCSLRFLDECETCNLCRKNCPTGAIGESSVIDAARCLTLYNEQNNPMPDWLPQDAHHTLIGCLRCQEICPMNKPLSEIAIHTLELDETETQILLSSDSGKLPEELKLKFIKFGLNEHFISIVGRNANLALKNITAGRYF